jgi:hypothetical protein
MKKGVHRDVDTETIVCPFNNNNSEGPVLIRVEKTEKSGLSVALPAFGGGPKTSMTYFTVFRKEILFKRLQDYPNQNDLGRSAFTNGVDVSRCLLNQQCFESQKN